MKNRFLLGGLGVVVLAMVVSGVLLAVYPGLLIAGGEGGAKAMLQNADGNPVGTVKLSQEDDGSVLIKVKVHNLPAGFHGFHVHGTGTCTAPAFTSAGGHFNPGSQTHPSHAADLPVLLVNSDGTGEARVKTDRFGVADLSDADGSAFIIHASPDNYANIPTRYAPAGPDATTLATGDAGGRIACGVIESQN